MTKKCYKVSWVVKMMDCLVTIENAMKTYNLLSLHMPESHWGGLYLITVSPEDSFLLGRG